MSFQIKVRVQMPDGSFADQPVAYWDGKEWKVKEFDNKKDAYDWAEFCLHEKVTI